MGKVIGYFMIVVPACWMLADLFRVLKTKRQNQMITHQTIEMQPYRKQKSWLNADLLHSAPSAEFVKVNGKDGAQLEHPRGGPLTWVQCPHADVTGVIRIESKWYWLIARIDGDKQGAQGGGNHA